MLVCDPLTLPLAKKNGQRDCRRDGLGDDPIGVLGTAARYVAESQLDGNTIHQIGEDMGAPTDIFDDGTNVRIYQAASRGLRHYRNRLIDLPEESGGSIGSGVDEARTGRRTVGVETIGGKSDERHCKKPTRAISFCSQCV